MLWDSLQQGAGGSMTDGSTNRLGTRFGDDGVGDGSKGGGNTIDSNADAGQLSLPVVFSLGRGYKGRFTISFFSIASINTTITNKPTNRKLTTKNNSKVF